MCGFGADAQDGDENFKILGCISIGGHEEDYDDKVGPYPAALTVRGLDRLKGAPTSDGGEVHQLLSARYEGAGSGTPSNVAACAWGGSLRLQRRPEAGGGDGTIIVQKVPHAGLDWQRVEALRRCPHQSLLSLACIIPCRETALLEWESPGEPQTLADVVRRHGGGTLSSIAFIQQVLVGGFAALSALHSRGLTLWGVVDFSSVCVPGASMGGDGAWLLPWACVLYPHALDELLPPRASDRPAAKGCDFRLGAAADVYALGSLALRMLNGRPVNAGALVDEASAFSEDGRHLMTLCLAKDPAFRITAEKALLHPFLQLTVPVKRAVSVLEIEEQYSDEEEELQVSHGAVYSTLARPGRKLGAVNIPGYGRVVGAAALARLLLPRIGTSCFSERGAPAPHGKPLPPHLLPAWQRFAY